MMLQEGGVKIWRPRQVWFQVDGLWQSSTDSGAHQIFVGASKRDYVPINERVEVAGPRKTPAVIVHSG
jgi:citrate synthase